MLCCFLARLRPPRPTRTDTVFPCTTLVLSRGRRQEDARRTTVGVPASPRHGRQFHCHARVPDGRVFAGDAACAVDPVGGPPPVVRPGVGASPRGGEAARQAAAIAVPPVGGTQARVIVAGRVTAIDGKARRTPGRCNRRPPGSPAVAQPRPAAGAAPRRRARARWHWPGRPDRRSEEHTSELQSLMRISYAVFCLKKK